MLRIALLFLLVIGSAFARDTAPFIRLPLSDGWTRRPAAEPPMHAIVSVAVGASLQADAGRALRVLEATPIPDPSRAESEFVECMRRRFGPAGDGAAERIADPFAADLTRLFRAYWHEALLSPSSRQAAEQALAQGLRKLAQAPETASLDELDPLIIERLHSAGFDALMGRTSPLRELILWRNYALRRFHVALPEGERSVQVAILENFAVMGWADYATCGLRGAGGWARDHMLYAVRPRYADLRGEDFTVTFLGHETQHLVDLERFPGFEPWRLEYRAKLAELALAAKSRGRILGKLLEDQGDDPQTPHAFANKRVLAGLRERLGADLAHVPASDLQQAASSLLAADTRLRN